MSFDRSIAVLGSTGSIGTQSLEVAQKHGMRVKALAANKNIKLLEEQIRRFSPERAAVFDKAAAKELKIAVADTGTKVSGGETGVIDLAFETRCDNVINAIMGEAGLLPTLSVIESGKSVALANKETLVVAGEIVMQKAKEKGVSILPVDSEHCAIMQCLEGHKKENVKRIVLTASGGPFFGKTREELAKVTPEMALAHPTWSMGKKITVDSATLMNKGFEVIEAYRLFGVGVDRIDVVVHFESIIHSFVEYIDNAVIAQLGVPDMRTCIQYALTYPDRLEGLEEQLDLAKVGKLTFAYPDKETFTLLPLAYEAVRKGGTYPAALNGANEEAVGLFLGGKIGFTDIFDLVSDALRSWKDEKPLTLNNILEADRYSRAYVREAACK